MNSRIATMISNIAWNELENKLSLFYSKEIESQFKKSISNLSDVLNSNNHGKAYIEFLHLFSGHEGKIAEQLIESSSQNLSSHLKSLRYAITNASRDALTNLPPTTFPSPVDLIDSLSEKHNNGSSILKNICLPVFQSPTVENISIFLEHVPLSCRDAFNIPEFEHISGQIISTIINHLRAFESGLYRVRAQYVRSRFLNVLISEKLSPQLYSQNIAPVFLDTNGLFIQIKGMSSHLPYGLITDESVTSLEKLKLLSPEDLAELRSQIYFERSQYDAYKQAEDARSFIRLDVCRNPLTHKYIEAALLSSSHIELSNLISYIHTPISERSNDIENTLKHM
ncbi:MAG: hypothetical protein RLY57_671, partial [Candidatus Parcubacteria bacterium]